MMRVTNAQIRATMIRRVNTAQSNLLKFEEQAATGRRVPNPADDPTATAISRRIDASLEELESFEPASRQVSSRLETADATLVSVYEQLIGILELSLYMSNVAARDAERISAVDESN